MCQRQRPVKDTAKDMMNKISAFCGWNRMDKLFSSREHHNFFIKLTIHVERDPLGHSGWYPVAGKTEVDARVEPAHLDQFQFIAIVDFSLLAIFYLLGRVAMIIIVVYVTVTANANLFLIFTSPRNRRRWITLGFAIQ